MRSVFLLSLLAFVLVACDTGGGDTTAEPDTCEPVDVVADSGEPDLWTEPDLVEPLDVVAVPDVPPDVVLVPDVALDVPPDVPQDVAMDVPEEDTWVEPCPTAEELEEPAVGGMIYEDGDHSSLSWYAQAMQEPTDHPLEDVLVSMTGMNETVGAYTCPNGRFSFGAVEDGVYVLGVQPLIGRHGTSHNLSTRFQNAVAERAVTIVTFGDSIPVYGGEPHFPAVLEDFIGPLAEVDNRVVARSGSTSSEWVPGSNYFENRLAPELADADVVIGSVGGNDLSEFFDVYSTNFDREELVAKLGGFPDFLNEVTGRIVNTLEEIRERAPQADIVYITYCNYARSERWQQLSGEYSGLAEYGLDNALRIMRQTIAQVPGVLIADMYASTAGEDLNPYLWDEIHLSTAGAARWAREIFMLLGGVQVGEDPFGLYREYGVGTYE